MAKSSKQMVLGALASPYRLKAALTRTGGAGYIGSHIVLSCLLTGKYRVCTIDNFHNSYPEAMKRVTQIAQDALPSGASAQDKSECEIKVFKGDITNKSDIEKIFKEYKDAQDPIWGVIHVAAHKAVGESGEKPIQYYENNITATINLLDVMSRYEAYHLVYSSSATVYGAPTTIPIPESTPLAPESCYGRTKMMSELIIKDLCDSQPDKWRAIGLRYFNPAGCHPSGLIGEDPVGKPGNLLPLLAAIAVGRFPNDLKVFGQDYPTPDGTCVRDYLSVTTLGDGHVLALAALDKEETFAKKAGASGFGGSGGKYKAYNLGGGKGSSVLEIVEAMRKASGFDFKTTVEGRRLGDVPDLTADPTLAEKELGFKANIPLDECCRNLWNWSSKNPNGYRAAA
ncbi:uncharacterized protein L969DRAFT_18118 [Mixia osmundae IAM 14324]|uniref:UDP-glucose 4-epimerase n=1 Tax=Mixia osmundae (strain CBS 9802 / IAM 14324 / JCM 22182 / KY 12970) TaxID=764103 RepID=G7E6W4_MIXOS|nr:uncharacterized protein L969DRAFT_18118 [Mixia osmundae IAM 14324]KEI39044.1 hypothetical protein L969DRAFT_18118 [Mixia osmundae IAM 14324]GAA98574.1 hypothetical protein E5Q_05261 [Mixia osmundae IAM 14324]